MSFCYHLLYFIKILILFLIFNFIRCHCYYFYAHNWLMVIEEFTFHFYLSMLIDVTWYARVGIFCTLKSLPKIKSNAKNFPALTNPISFSLIFFLMS